MANKQRIREHGSTPLPCSEDRTKTMDRRGRYRNRYRNRSQRSWLSRLSDALPQAPMAIATATPIPTPTAKAAPPSSCRWVRTVRMSYCFENRRSADTQMGALHRSALGATLFIGIEGDLASSLPVLRYPGRSAEIDVLGRTVCSLPLTFRMACPAAPPKAPKIMANPVHNSFGSSRTFASVFTFTWRLSRRRGSKASSTSA